MLTAQNNARLAVKVLGWVVLMAAAAGCQARQTVFNADGMDKGLVIVLPGIDGQTPYSEAACRALAARCADGAGVELYDWTSPLGALHSQTAQERNRRQAAALAERIAGYQAAHPGRPVHLIGHSGGTAIAVWAAEDLPTQASIDGIVLLASSLSGEYDLSAALARSRKGIVNFCSDRDVMLLDIGTRLVGTMDGRHVVAAGNAGFSRPAAGDRAGAYSRLFEVRWDEQSARHGNDGGHFSCMSSRFVARAVAPLLAASDWASATLASSADAGVLLAAGGPAALR